MGDPLVCDRCAGPMTYYGRISLPAQTIDQCESCGNQEWAAAEPAPPYRPQGSQPVEQPQAQQQQQPQPNPDEE